MNLPVINARYVVLESLGLEAPQGILYHVLGHRDKALGLDPFSLVFYADWISVMNVV